MPTTQRRHERGERSKTLIRPAIQTDLAALEGIAAGTNMFVGEELQHFMSSMEAHLFATPVDAPPSDTLLVATDTDAEGAPAVGAAYFRPEAMAQGVMNLLFIGVLPEARQRGHGAALLAAFEDAVSTSDARLAIIETASDNMFAPAWELYRSRGYDEEARVRDYYDDGLDKLVFRKRMSP